MEILNELFGLNYKYVICLNTVLLNINSFFFLQWRVFDEYATLPTGQIRDPELVILPQLI